MSEKEERKKYVKEGMFENMLTFEPAVNVASQHQNYSW